MIVCQTLDFANKKQVEQFEIQATRLAQMQHANTLLVICSLWFQINEYIPNKGFFVSLFPL
jgi:hypothetical protein